MKIYLMRHFERTSDIRFFSSLIDIGKQNAKNKILEIEELNIDVIFSSPFLRTLQSIEPYCVEKRKLVNVENSLYEFMESNQFTLENYKHTYHEHDDKLKEIVNLSYQSFLNIDDIEKPRLGKNNEVAYEKLIMKRIKDFLIYLHKTYENTDKNILLVSHKSTINAMLMFIEEYTTKKVTREIFTPYEMGEIVRLPQVSFEYNFVDLVQKESE